MQFAVVEPAKRDRVLVADLAGQRARLGKANMVRLARRAAADDAWLSVATNLQCSLSRRRIIFGCDATAASFWFLRQDDWSRHRGLH